MTRSVTPVRGLVAAMALAAFGLGGAGLAQPAPKSDDKATGLSITYNWRLRYENRQDAAFDQSQFNDPRDLYSRLRIGFAYDCTDGVRFFLQPQYAHQQKEGTSKPSSTDNDVNLYVGYAEFGDKRARWRVGRQELSFGDSRLMASPDWGNYGRSYDGVRLTIADKRTVTDLFGAKIGYTVPKTADPLIAGVYSTITRNKGLGYDLYLLYKDVPMTASKQNTVHTVGMRPKLKIGPFDATLEAAYQFGKYGSRPISAYACVAAVGYTVPGKNKLRLGIEHDHASGGNPDAGTYKTFDNLYPSNHSSYGTFDYVGLRNMRSWRLSAKGSPAPKWTVGVDGWFYQLDDKTDSWYSDNGKPVVGANGKGMRDPTGLSGRDLGTELDLQVDYQAMKSLTVSAGYARFMPGSFVRNVNSGHADASNWFYVQTNVKF